MFSLFTSLSKTKTHPVKTNYSLDLDGRVFLGCKNSLTKTSNHFLVEVSVWWNILCQSRSQTHYVTYIEQMENRNTPLAS